jgi:hypothetical protein
VPASVFFLGLTLAIPTYCKVWQSGNWIDIYMRHKPSKPVPHTVRSLGLAGSSTRGVVIFLYWDVLQSCFISFIGLWQVKTNFRTAITVPEKSWARFRDIFADYCEKMKEGGEKVSVGGGSDGGPSAKWGLANH